METPQPIIIATLNTEKALFMIAKEAMNNDEIELRFTEKYAPTVEYLLRLLRKAFALIEQDRGTTTVINKKCLWNQEGYCTNKKITENETRIRCVEPIRLNCKEYNQKQRTPLHVNYVVIEKVGQAKGL